MCGITGFIEFLQTSPREVLSERISEMSDRLSHRGPDDAGFWVDEKCGVALGHRRLSIIDQSQHGHQPMVSHNHRFVMAYNGEIYNFRQLQGDLSQLGAHFTGHSDTEVLLAAFALWGVEKTLSKINGMFAIALFDKETQQLYLIRDRLGKKPLYYGRQGSHVYFSSELKAIRHHPNFSASINRAAVSAYVQLNYVPTPLSIYEGIYKLLPGTYVVISVGQQTISEPIYFWNHRAIAETPLNTDWNPLSARDALHDLLKDSVSLRMISDVPIGAFLSGGIDSSLVVSLMQAQSSQPVRTFTIGFQEEGYNEATEAKAVAQHLGTQHTELYVSPAEAQSVIPNLPSIYDEPFSDVSQIPTYLVSKLARSQVTVALSGDGGDEFFAGYNRHFWVPMLWRRVAWIPRAIRYPMLKAAGLLPPQFYRSIPKLGQKNLANKVYKLLDMLSAKSPSEMYIQLISSWTSPEALVRDGVNTVSPYYKAYFRESTRDLMHTMMTLDAIHYLADDILVKLDRASMAVSLEARSPLLDYRVVEFAWQLPLAYKAKGQQGKLILKEILNQYLPSQLIDRPKMGFGVPIGQWLRGPLKNWAHDLLQEDTLIRQGFFHPSVINKKWRQHQQGHRNAQYSLWNILMFQAWLQENER